MNKIVFKTIGQKINVGSIWKRGGNYYILTTNEYAQYIMVNLSSGMIFTDPCEYSQEAVEGFSFIGEDVTITIS